MNINWSLEKNKLLQQERGVCLEDVINAINNNDLIDTIKHPNFDKYPNQFIYIIKIFGYIYMVPYIKDDDEIFLKTIVPSRKMNKIYNKGQL
jgi:hypothetical protein